MKRDSNAPKSTLYVIVAALLLLAASAGRTYAQSSDPDQPTPLTSNVIEGEGDGQAAVYYYRFAAGTGDVKITVDAKATPYSTLMDVELTDEDGKQLEKVGVVATSAGKREVIRHRFLRQMPAILKISIREDKDVKQLTYKIKLEGEVGLSNSAQAPSASPSESSAQQSASDSSDPSAVQAESASAAEASAPADAQADAGQQQQSQGSALKQKAKEKAKTAAAKAANKVLDKFPF